MRSGKGVDCLQTEDRFRELLDAERLGLKQRLEQIQTAWTRFSGQPEIPRLALPFEEQPLFKAMPDVPELSFVEIDILSLDIFDTCLHRLSGDPETVFEMLERRMAVSGNPCPEFTVKRVEAEARLRERLQKSGVKEDVSLEEIYSELGDLMGWQAADTRFCESEETTLEQSLVAALPEVRDLANRAHEKGLQVIYISEMYLPADCLEGMLKKAGFPVSSGSVFASGTIGLSKGSGRLYQYVRERFPGMKFLHIGDNPETDTALPDNQGIPSRLIGRVGNPYPDALSNLLAGIVATGNRDRDFWQQLGYRMVGPLATGWMLHVLRNIGSLEQVLFLTRDGYFPKKAFDALAPLLGIGTASRTCFSSRRLLGLAAMDTITASDWDFLLKPAPGFRIHDFFDRVDVPESVYHPVCVDAGMDPEEQVCHHRGFHNPATKDRLYGLFVQVMDAFYPVRDGLRQRVLAYLESLSFPARRSGIVDIGWNGSSFECLERLSGTGSVKAAYYLALWESRQHPETGSGRLWPWFISGEAADKEERLIRGGVGLMEFLMGSPFGSVVDLRDTDGAWKPVTSKPEVVGPYERHAYARIEEGFNDFLEAFVAARGYLAPSDGKAFLSRSLQQLIYDPNPDEICLLGALSHVEGWGSGNRFRLLPRTEDLEDTDQRRLAYAYSAWKGAWQNLEFA